MTCVHHAATAVTTGTQRNGGLLHAIRSLAGRHSEHSEPSVPISGVHAVTDEVVTLLAAGFARGVVGDPAIPYAKTEG